mgnify:CR=1 FL=1
MSYPTLPIGAELKEQLALKYHSRRNLMLIGDHGIGKTEFLKSLADDLGISRSQMLRTM